MYSNISSKNKYTKSMPVVSALILAALVVISFIFLSNLLGVFAREEMKTDIDLMSAPSQSAGFGSNTLQAAENGAPSFNISNDSGTQCWESSTNINVFKVSYENGNGIVTALSQNGDKIIAPGTANDYSFVLNNTGKTAIDYKMTVEAYLSDNISSIPVQVKLKDYKGNYLVGSENVWQSVSDLNGVTDSSSLSAGYHATYTFGWQWPFEGDDAFDTQLGNLEEGENITLTLVIKTVASSNAVLDSNEGQPPNTDSYVNIVIWFALFASSLFVLLLILFYRRREKEEESADAE